MFQNTSRERVNQISCLDTLQLKEWENGTLGHFCCSFSSGESWKISMEGNTSNIYLVPYMGHYFIHITSRHTSFGLDTQSRDLGASRPMHHLKAHIEAAQSLIDYLQFWLTFTNNGRYARSNRIKGRVENLICVAENSSIKNRVLMHIKEKMNEIFELFLLSLKLLMNLI